MASRAERPGGRCLKCCGIRNSKAVRYFGGVKLGAGGLVRAYTDCVAKALLDADKVLLVRQCTLRCALPYALEGLVRREIDDAGAKLLQASHSECVELVFSLPEDFAPMLVGRLNEAGHGSIAWLESEETD